MRGEILYNEDVLAITFGTTTHYEALWRIPSKSTNLGPRYGETTHVRLWWLGD